MMRTRIEAWLLKQLADRMARHANMVELIPKYSLGKSVALDRCEIEEIEKLNQKLLYIYAGDKELNGECKKIALKLKCILKDANYCFDDNALHQEQAWKKKILEALNYLVL